MMNEKLISIITVCFNSAKTIRRTIESVLNQTYDNIEYILVDGNSTDNTLDIIEEYVPLFAAKGIIYRYVSEPDKGIYDAMNKGIKMATGEWVGIINSDDWYELDACDNIVNKISRLGNIEMIGGIVRLWNNSIKYSVKQNDLSSIYSDTIMHPGVFVKKNVYSQIGLFDNSYKIAADYDFFIRCYLTSVKYIIFESVVANFSMDGISSINCYTTSQETHLIKYRHGIISRLTYYFKYTNVWLKNKLNIIK